MKSTGVVRKVDELGRIVVPIEVRRSLGIDNKDPLEIYVDDDKIVLKKYIPDVERQEVKDGLKNFDRLSKKQRKDILERAIKIVG